MENKKVYDISPEISPELAVFPGDVPFSRNVSMDCANGDTFGLSSINTTVHLGAHVDAPNHYHRDGVGISERPLNFYMGHCQVIEISKPQGSRLVCSDLEGIKVLSERVLFKTNSFLNPNSWQDNFNSLSKELVLHLASLGVKLVGIDTPSIDLAQDKKLESHNAIFSKDMAILEGIVLQGVTSGEYDLVALPLKIKGADASPVRAILIER